MTKRLLLSACSVLLAACGRADTGRDTGVELVADSLVVRLSAQYAQQIGEDVGTARDGRFSPDGSRIVIFDKYSPHLRVFTSYGRLLWKGGLAGDGPRELRPSAAAFNGRQVAVAGAQRVSFWT